MNAGTAKIVTNAGVGVYTITQVFWDPDSGTFVTGTTGFTNVTATDVNLVDDHEVDKIVCFRYQTHYDADTGPIIWASSGTTASSTDIMTLDKWYSVEANQVWTTIDDRDWTGRWIKVTMVSDKEDLEDILTDEYVGHWDTFADGGSGDYVLQAGANYWFRILLSDTGDSNISRCLFDSGGVTPEGDFYLGMSSGAIQYKVENYDSNFSIRFSMISSAEPPTEEIID